MRSVIGLLVLTSALLAAGCTHRSLAHNTVMATSTVMDIQYESVLANLAMMSCHPEALPNHVHLAQGVVQISDDLEVGRSGGLTLLGTGNMGVETLGPGVRRRVSEQWGTDATTDPESLYDLQCLYRATLGLPPLPPPNGIAYLRPAESSSDGKKKDSNDDNGRGVPVDVLLTDVPLPGWYNIGCKKDVPKDAIYVGRWGDRYAWVCHTGMSDLARFTITALAVIRLEPGEGESGSGGLANTGGQ